MPEIAARPRAGQTALITGASRGLGFAVAEALAQTGAHVIGVARTTGGLEALDERIRAAQGTMTLVPLDLTDDEGLANLGAAIHQRWGQVDLWVHTAIHAPPLSPVEHVADKDLDRVLAVNIRAVQRTIRVIDPLLRMAPDPAAVFFGDTGAAGQRFHAGYAAGKAAAHEITRLWRDETRTTTRLRVLDALPPPMPTSLRGRFYPGEDRSRLTDPATVAGRLMTALAPLPETGAVLDLRNA